MDVFASGVPTIVQWASKLESMPNGANVPTWKALVRSDTALAICHHALFDKSNPEMSPRDWELARVSLAFFSVCVPHPPEPAALSLFLPPADGRPPESCGVCPARSWRGGQPRHRNRDHDSERCCSEAECAHPPHQSRTVYSIVGSWARCLTSVSVRPSPSLTLLASITQLLLAVRISPLDEMIMAEWGAAVMDMTEFVGTGQHHATDPTSVPPPARSSLQHLTPHAHVWPSHPPLAAHAESLLGTLRLGRFAVYLEAAKVLLPVLVEFCRESSASFGEMASWLVARGGAAGVGAGAGAGAGVSAAVLSTAVSAGQSTIRSAGSLSGAAPSGAAVLGRQQPPSIADAALVAAAAIGRQPSSTSQVMPRAELPHPPRMQPPLPFAAVGAVEVQARDVAASTGLSVALAALTPASALTAAGLSSAAEPPNRQSQTETIFGAPFFAEAPATKPAAGGNDVAPAKAEAAVETSRVPEESHAACVAVTANNGTGAYETQQEPTGL